jgi:hypothetical protein
MNEFVPQMMQQLFSQSPTLIVYVAAIMFAFSRWSKNPGAAGLVATGAVLLLIVSIASGLAMPFFVNHVLNANPANAHSILMVTGFLISGAHAVGVAMIVAAAFVGREPVYRD